MSADRSEAEAVHAGVRVRVHTPESHGCWVVEALAIIIIIHDSRHA